MMKCINEFSDHKGYDLKMFKGNVFMAVQSFGACSCLRFFAFNKLVYTHNSRTTLFNVFLSCTQNSSANYKLSYFVISILLSLGIIFHLTLLLFEFKNFHALVLNMLQMRLDYFRSKTAITLVYCKSALRST
jgi:hypothetical protein